MNISKPKNVSNSKVEISQVVIENENYFKISNCNNMPTFFMSIVSDSNHWLFIASNGGITAGRTNSEFALFPYYTSDKITESADVTGSKTIFQVEKNSEQLLWEPLSERFDGMYKITRNLYKNTYGNKVIFEEINHDLGLTFSYQWSSSNEFGFVRKSILINNSATETNVSLVDGIQNVIPAGIGEWLQNNYSNLVDAYKRNELDKKSGLGIYALSAIIVDRAEPSEALKANIAWSLGFKNCKYLVSSLQLDQFRNGQAITEEVDVKAEKGAYFINADITLTAKAEKRWTIITNVNQNHAGVVRMMEMINTENNLAKIVDENIELGTQNLIQLNAGADGIQMTGDKLRDARHFSNTLFNIMRGGIFDNNFQIEKWDFHLYLAKANKAIYENFKNTVDTLAETFTISELKALANKQDNSDFKRLCLEYLPLKFSRRHGDPSRPWNKFSINTRNEDGSKILDYQGNWRDIFQNWEALVHAYPEFIESMIHKFLNASTFDGYNPYRVTKDGFDWEAIEPEDPQSYIGYWGDHQIIYLLKFLEFIEKHVPGSLEKSFDKNVFVYANVPYKIKSYQETLNNPKKTVDFDEDLHEAIQERRAEFGADGALLQSSNGAIYKVNFIEKILATVLAKISNFIPEGGIWMNTQRPEWNDANNALVGNGVSMVTLYYLRRFLSFFQPIFENAAITEVEISAELATFFNEVVATFEKHQALLEGSFDDVQRKTVLDGLGEAGSTFRLSVYEKSFSGKKVTITKADLSKFVNISLEYLEHSIDANERTDNLYHAYNLMTVESDKAVSIDYLAEMLEGQVALLSAKYLPSKMTLKVLDSLKASALFRPNQYTYMLYPNKDLLGFLAKNKIPAASVEQSELLQKLVKDGNTQLIEKDARGDYHFNGNFRNADDVQATLETFVDSDYANLAESNSDLVLQIFEEVFNHKAFTGRSGTFFGYEGLGSTYWHMVSKLLLAVQENCLDAINAGEDAETVGRLLEHYYEINAGIGVHKSPELYGAFPTDPYSHTPAGRGAQQPGMTGQVKEDILSRFGEFGVFVNDGQLYFNPCLLRKQEFLAEAQTYDYININGEAKQLELKANSLCFTYCQVPIVYEISDKNSLKVVGQNGDVSSFDSLSLDKATSSEMFSRTGNVREIHVEIMVSDLK